MNAEPFLRSYGHDFINFSKELFRDDFVFNNVFEGVEFFQRKWERAPVYLNQLSWLKTAARNVWKVCSTVKQLIASLISKGMFKDFFRLFGGAGYAFSSGEDSPLKRFAAVYSNVSPVFKWVGLFSAISVPFTLIGIGRKTHLIIKNRYERVNNFLAIIKDLGCVLEGVAGFAKGVSAVGAVPARKVMFTGPLAVVGVLLGGAGLVSTAYEFRQTLNFSKEFDFITRWNDEGQITDDSFNDIIDFLVAQSNMDKEARKEKYHFLKKHFDVNGKDLNIKLIEISNRDVRLSSEERTALIKTLRHRIFERLLSTALSFVANLVEFVAFPIFLLAPLVVPVALPFGFVCIIIGTCIATACVAFDWYKQYCFDKKIQAY